jgi:hypothetical protein
MSKLSMRVLGRLPALKITSLSLLVLTAGTAQALVGGYRQPINAAGGDQLYKTVNQDVLEANPDRDVIVSNDGYKTITSFQADQTKGTLKGYVSYQLDADTTINRPTSPGLVGADATFGFYGNVKAQPGTPPSTPLNAVFELTVHGSFSEISGQPWLALAGGLGVSRIHGGSEDDYNATLTFSNVTAAGWQSTVDAQLDYSGGGVIAGAAGDPATTWGAGSQIISKDPSNLSAVLRLIVPVVEGDLLVTSGVVGATATHSYTQDPNSVGIGEDILIRAARGAVDFSNTGTLRIYLPEGISLIGPNAPGGAILATAAVPEPATAALALIGLAVIAGLALKGRRPLSAACSS